MKSSRPPKEAQTHRLQCLESDSYRLRGELEELHNQACAALRGERSRSAPKSVADARADREVELQDLGERIEWYKRDIKILKRQVETVVAQGDHDPQELQNLITERRAEIQTLCEEEDVLARMAEKQNRAERQRAIVSDEVADQVRRVKEAVEREKKRHLQLREVRAKMDQNLKVQRAEVWEMERRLKHNVSVINQANSPRGEPASLQKLQRHEAVLREALQQEERKYKAEAKDRERGTKNLQQRNADTKKKITRMEARVKKIRAKLGGMAVAVGPQSPHSGDELSQRSPEPSPRYDARFDVAFEEHEEMKRDLAQMEMQEELESLREKEGLDIVHHGKKTIDFLQDNLPGRGLDDDQDDDDL